MALEVLYVGRHDLSRWTQSIREFEKNQNTQIILLSEVSIELAYNHLFSQRVGLVVIDSDFEIDMLSDFISTIKNDTALHHIFVMVIIPHTNKKETKLMLQLGQIKLFP